MSTSITLREAYEIHYLPDLKAKARPSTIESYELDLLRWERFSQNPPIGEIGNATLSSFRNDARDSGLAVATVNSTLRTVRAILRRMGPQMDKNPLGVGVLTRIPYCVPLAEDRDWPVIATDLELNALYENCDVAKWPDDIIPAPEFWRTILVCAYNLGPRMRDLFALRTVDADFEKRTVRFITRKTRRTQVVPMNDVVARHLLSIWSDRALIFQGIQPALRRDNRSAFNQLIAIASAANVQTRINFQTLRKTSGSAYAAFGWEIAAFMLGHYIPGVTMQFYVNPTKNVIDAANNLPQPSAFLAQKTYCVRSTPKPTEWQFSTTTATFRGLSILLPERELAALRTLVQARRPVTFQDLRLSAFWNRPDVSTMCIKGVVHRLRRSLVAALGIPANPDPIRWGENGWTLALPEVRG